MNALNTPVVQTGNDFFIQKSNLVELGKKYGTPLYIYDIDHVLGRYRHLAKALNVKNLRLHYAMKANYNLDILCALRDEKASIDAVSPAEVFLALKAGFPKENILYTANNLTDEDLTSVHETGVLMNIDSLSCLDRLGRTFPGSTVCLRFNSDVVAGENAHVQTGGDRTKFGILLEDAPRALEIVKRHNLVVVGLHEHTGSGIAEAESFYQGMRNLLSIATPQNFPDLRFVDFGGGFKVAYKPDDHTIDYEAFGKKAALIFSDFCKSYGRDLTLCFEPGKFMVAEAGVFLAQVNTLKNNRGRLIAGTNSGFGHLIRPMLYGAYHHILNISNPNGPEKTYDIVGNICETGDLFGENRTLPEIREGDYLAILNAGAYCHSMASIYNLRPLPTEVVIKGDVETLSRKTVEPHFFAEMICMAYANNR